MRLERPALVPVHRRRQLIVNNECNPKVCPRSRHDASGGGSSLASTVGTSGVG